MVSVVDFVTFILLGSTVATIGFIILWIRRR